VKAARRAVGDFDDLTKKVVDANGAERAAKSER
jgi:hypothetical protein